MIDKNACQCALHLSMTMRMSVVVQTADENDKVTFFWKRVEMMRWRLREYERGERWRGVETGVLGSELGPLCVE
jgi:hypothetical protein